MHHQCQCAEPPVESPTDLTGILYSLSFGSKEISIKIFYSSKKNHNVKKDPNYVPALTKD